MVPPPKQCGVSFVIRVAEGVDPYGYVAAYPPPPPKRRRISFGKRRLFIASLWEGGGPRSGGRSPRNEGFKVSSSQRILPHPTPSGAPSRRGPHAPSNRHGISFVMRDAREVVPYDLSCSRRRNNTAYRSLFGSAQPPRVPRATPTPTAQILKPSLF